MRVIKMVAAAALIAVAGSLSSGAPPAAAEGMILYVAPHDGETIEISAITMPCAVSGSSSQDASADPSQGTFDLAAGAAVENCVNHGRDRWDVWTLGEVPALLVGMPATIIADIEMDSTVAYAGTGTRHARVGLSLGTDDLDGDYDDLVRASCTGSGCTQMTRDRNVQVIQQLDALPATLHAVFHSQVHVADATGSIEITATGTLRHVLIVPTL